jgi:hypothetical protein
MKTAKANRSALDEESHFSQSISTAREAIERCMNDSSSADDVASAGLDEDAAANAAGEIAYAMAAQEPPVLNPFYQDPPSTSYDGVGSETAWNSDGGDYFDAGHVGAEYAGVDLGAEYASEYASAGIYDAYSSDYPGAAPAIYSSGYGDEYTFPGGGESMYAAHGGYEVSACIDDMDSAALSAEYGHGPFDDSVPFSTTDFLEPSYEGLFAPQYESVEEREGVVESKSSEDARAPSPHAASPPQRPVLSRQSSWSREVHTLLVSPSSQVQ